jgi:O-antigen/teichoic acid export membrane protein
MSLLSRPSSAISAAWGYAWSSGRVVRDLLAAQVLTAGASLVVNVISARGMGPSGRGALAFYLQLVYLIGAVCIAGADRALPAVRRRPPAVRTAEREMLRLVAPSFGATAVVLLAGIAAAALLPASHGWGVLLACAFFAALWGNVGLVAFRSAGITAQETGRFLAATGAAQALLVAGAAVLLGASVESPTAWLALYGAAFLLPLVGALASRARPGVDAGTVRYARRLGWRLTPMVVANMVMLRSDRLLLPLLADATQLGLYVVVATVTELLTWPVQNYADGRIPALRAGLESGRLAVGRLFGTVGAYAVTAALLVALVLNVLLVPVFGAAYEQSRALIWPLAAAAALYAVSRPGTAICLAAGRPSRANLIDLSGMAVAVPAYLLLIPAAGAMGAALGTLLASAATAVVAVVVSGRVRSMSLGAAEVG